MDSMNSLLLAEFYSSTGYLDRLIFAFSEIEKNHLTPSGKIQIQKILNEQANFVSKNFQNLGFIVENDFSFEFSKFKNQINSFNNFFESFLKMPLSNASSSHIYIEYINMIYRNSFELHQLLLRSSQLEIDLPRTGLIDEEFITSLNANHESNKVPLFYLNEDKIAELSNNEKILKKPLAFLDIRRSEKYDEFIHKGHFKITSKEYDEALSIFSKAKNYKETAEVYTLIAWTYSLLNNFEQAKVFCLKAIEKDTQYGPAYNDYGNYLLNEGKTQESLRWFELAKRAQNYQNREYPYINAGRAYVQLRDYETALNEFSLALTIAPHHEELHDTVARLKISLEKNTPRANTNPNETTV